MVKEAVINGDMEATPYRVLMSEGIDCARIITDRNKSTFSLKSVAKKDLGRTPLILNNF